MTAHEKLMEAIKTIRVNYQEETKMTREEFNEKVMNQYKAFEEKEMAKSPVQMFNDAYEIAKMISLKDYLTEEDDERIEKLYPYADTILNDLYTYEWNYDEVQWASWDNISNMIYDLLMEM